MTYQPQPGTIAYRAVEWLKAKPKGQEVTASVWAEAIGSDGTTLIGCLATAVSSGLVKRRQQSDNKRLVWWSMGDGQPEAREPEVLPHRNVAPEVKPQPGAMFPGVRGDEPVPPAPPLKVPKFTGQTPEPTTAPVSSAQLPGWRPIAEERAAAKPAPFDCWLSGVSGELVLQGVKVDADGDAIIEPEKVAAIRRVLLGVAP